MILDTAWNYNANQYLIAINSTGTIHHIPVKNSQAANKAAGKLSNSGWDVYWAIAGFDGPRKALNATDIKAFWIDLDSGEGKPYQTWKEALKALLNWITHHKMIAPTHIIRSGNGLHIYWVLDETISHSDWLPVAQQFKRSLRLGDYAVKADPQRTADAASILRVPGTYNYKDPDKPKKVVELFSGKKTVSLEKFKNSLPATGPRPVLDQKANIADEWTVPTDFPPSSAEKVADNCQQMQYFRELRGAVSEPYWRAGLSIIKRCEDGNTLIHEWSKGDPRYNHKETQYKADNTVGPATCEHFKDVNPEGCEGCKADVTSPIQLGVTVSAASPDPDAPDWKLNKIGNFRVRDNGVWLNPKEGPAVQITCIPIWIKEVRERARLDQEQDESSLLVSWITIDGRNKTGVVYQSHIYDMKSFKKWLADSNIISAVKEVKLLVSYISHYSLALMKKSGAKEYHSSLGWYQDGFSLGSEIVTKDGTKPALIQHGSPIAKLKPKGSLEEWKKAADILGKPGYRKHALSLLFGFASPIFPVVDVQSAVISLAGASGGGKTLAAQFALSIFGNPSHLMQGSAATDNSIEQQLVANRHAPYLLDEVTNFSSNRLANFVYLAANGQGKSSLKRNREFKEAGEWRLTPFITSNHPLLEMAQNSIQEAHRRRLLELSFEMEFPKEDAEVIYQTMMKNYGVAAVPYLQALNRLHSKLPSLFDQALKKVRKHTNVPDANRFGQWSLAAALLGGGIAKSLGLINFNIEKIIGVAAEALQENASETKSYSEFAQETLREFLTRNSDRICFWKENGKDLGTPVDDPVARVLDDDTIAVHAKLLNDEWLNNHISRSLIKTWLKENVKDQKAVRLAPRTTPIRSYCFREKAVEISTLTEGRK